MSQQPSVGRTVHYVSYGSPPAADGTQAFKSVCRAAVITEVDCDAPRGIDPETGTPCVGLAVLNPEGMFFNRHVPQNELLHDGGTWHWPERI